MTDPATERALAWLRDQAPEEARALSEAAREARRHRVLKLKLVADSAGRVTVVIKREEWA